MTHKQQAEFDAMKKAVNALIAQVVALTNDLQEMAVELNEVKARPAPEVAV